MNERTKRSEQIMEGCCGSATGDRTFQAEASRICPMSEMCAGFAGRVPLPLFLAVAGTILIGLGVLVLVEPKVLIWLIAGAVIVVGAASMVGALVTRRRSAGTHP